MKEETKLKLQATIFFVVCLLIFPGAMLWLSWDWNLAWQLALLCALFIYCTIWVRR